MMKPSGVVYNHELLLRAIESGLVTNKDGIGGAVRKSSSNILRMNKGHFNHSKNEKISICRQDFNSLTSESCVSYHNQ